MTTISKNRSQSIHSINGEIGDEDRTISAEDFGSDEIGFLNLSSSAAIIGSMVKETRDELENYKKLSARWDGYNGKIFKSVLVTKVLTVLGQIYYYCMHRGFVPSRIMPGPASDGSIDLFIRYENKSLTLTFYPDQDSFQSYQEGGGQIEESEETLDWSSMEKKLNWLFNS